MRSFKSSIFKHISFIEQDIMLSRWFIKLPNTIKNKNQYMSRFLLLIDLRVYYWIVNNQQKIPAMAITQKLSTLFMFWSILNEISIAIKRFYCCQFLNDELKVFLCYKTFFKQSTLNNRPCANYCYC